MGTLSPIVSWPPGVRNMEWARDVTVLAVALEETEGERRGSTQLLELVPRTDAVGSVVPSFLPFPMPQLIHDYPANLCTCLGHELHADNNQAHAGNRRAVGSRLAADTLRSVAHCRVRSQGDCSQG